MEIANLTDNKDHMKELSREETSGTGSSVHIRLSCGFETDLDEDCMDDQELLDDLIAFDRNHALYTNVLRRLLGNEGMDRLYECCRVRGKVRASLIVASMTELINQLKHGKKS